MGASIICGGWGFGSLADEEQKTKTMRERENHWFRRCSHREASSLEHLVVVVVRLGGGEN